MSRLFPSPPALFSPASRPFLFHSPHLILPTSAPFPLSPTIFSRVRRDRNLRKIPTQREGYTRDMNEPKCKWTGERKITCTKNRNISEQTKNNMVANAMCAKKKYQNQKQLTNLSLLWLKRGECTAYFMSLSCSGLKQYNKYKVYFHWVQCS